MLNMHLDRSPTSRAAGLAIALALVTTTATVAGVVASAQSTSASFSGLLEDAMGKILPETTLVLSSAQNQQTFKTTSDSNGRFTFRAIPAGDYELVADRAGFDKAQGRVTLGAGQRLNRDVVLQVGSLEETIRVYAGPPAKPSAPRPPAVTPTDEFDPCSQSPVGGCITQPSKLRDVKPIYPQAKNDAGVGGKVVVEARIGTDGFMKDFRVVSGDREFAAAAIEAFRGWQFSQTRLDGVPVEVNMKVTTTFVVP